jgi:hypothetical protein
MDATAYLALSAALDRELPTALDDARLAIERLRMEKEDLAVCAMTGRVNWNENMTALGSCFTWSGIECFTRKEGERWRQRVYFLWGAIDAALRAIGGARSAFVDNARRILEGALPEGEDRRVRRRRA